MLDALPDTCEPVLSPLYIKATPDFHGIAFLCPLSNAKLQ